MQVSTMLALTKDELLMLWQLLNAPGNGAPFKSAALASSLYEKARVAAESAGIVTA